MNLSQTGLLLLVTEICRWWAGQMRSLLPGSAARARRRRDAVIIAIHQSSHQSGHQSRLTGTVLLRRNGQETQLQTLDLASPAAASAATPPRLPVVLRMPPGGLLCRDVALPLAASRDLPAALGFEMDRLTPFAAAEVYWSAGAITADRARGRLTLRLAVVLRAEVEALLAALARWHLAPAFIEAETGRINLALARARPARWRQSALAGLCGLLALACLAAPVLRQQLALDAASRALAAAAPAAHTELLLRQQLSIGAAGVAAIAAARRAGDALQMLAALTGALPDDTWLSDLTYKSGGVTIDGQSANAARLIARLAGAPGLHDPGFTAPVTRTADGKADQFSLYLTAGP